MNGTAFFQIPILKKLSQVKPDRLVFIEENDPRVDPATNRRYNQGSFLQFKSLDNRWGDSSAAFHITDYVKGQDALLILYNPVYSAETSAEVPPNSTATLPNDLGSTVGGLMWIMLMVGLSSSRLE